MQIHVEFCNSLNMDSTTFLCQNKKQHLMPTRAEKYPNFLPSSSFSFQYVQRNSRRSAVSAHAVRLIPLVFRRFSDRTLISQQKPTSPPLQLHPSRLYVHDPRTESWLHESHCLLCHVMLSASYGRRVMSTRKVGPFNSSAPVALNSH